VGRLTEQKDIPTTLRAFERISKSQDVELVLLGEGELRGKLRDLAWDLGIEESVHMPGFVDNPFPYMRAADVLVLSSRWEGFGNVLVEAMACGTPVVSTECPGGPPEILRDGKYGKLVPVGDHKALADAVTQTLENPIGASRFVDRAIDFDYQKITKNYEDCIFTY